jgi:replicative DNA helicase
MAESDPIHLQAPPSGATAKAPTEIASASTAPLHSKEPEMLIVRKKRESTTEELLQSINRALPYSADAERGVLSCLLQDPSADRLSHCRSSLPGAAFYHQAHRTIYEMLLEFYDKNRPIDPIAVTEALRDQGLLEKIGGPGLITDLFTFITVTGHYDFYKKTLLDKYTLRQLIDACSRNIHQVYDHGREDLEDDVSTLIDHAEQRVLAVRESTGKEENIRDLASHVAAAIDDIQFMLEHPGQLRGLSTGYGKLDSLSNGLQAGEMFVIAARPSMGKTSLAMNIVEHIAVDQKRPVAVFSLEMSAPQLVRRLLVSRAQLSMSDLAKGLLTGAQQEALSRAIRELQHAQIFIDDTPGLDILELRAKARRLKKSKGISMIAIDYLQLLTSDSRRAKDNRQIEIAEISAGLKGLSKELEVPVLVLAQLNRSVEQRKGQRPVLSDLRESGSIEQDADMVGLLTRADYAGAKMEVEDEEKEAQKKGQALLILAKNRNGATDDVPLRFIDHAMRFVEREPDEQEQAGGS